jgi:hypothetical protein
MINTYAYLSHAQHRCMEVRCRTKTSHWSIGHAYTLLFLIAHGREQALELLSLKAANIPNEGAEASASWLTLLSGLPCYATIRPRLGEMLRCALAVETDVALVSYYLVHLRQSTQVFIYSHTWHSQVLSRRQSGNIHTYMHAYLLHVIQVHDTSASVSLFPG